MTIPELWGFVQAGGLPAALFLALVGVFRGWWVPSHVHQAVVQDRDEWKAIALENLNVASTSVDALKERRRTPRS